MATRHLYVVRHGAADPFGELTEAGARQSELLADRLARLPVDAVWHSPLPRAERCAHIIGARLPGVSVRAADELLDHVPHVPEDPPPAWAGFFDGYDRAEADDGRRRADALVERFACPAPAEAFEVLVTHATALTAIEYRDGAAPALLLYNDMGHLPADLRWTGFGPGVRP
ncbi:histidine phosphatase family protein [Streptomonospora nanhaiensis]|uniref:histidine phosphatase family protein n=1 Tax=Streptomonospora nanhaiensis TaxID=1323731 RepID=UPI001C3883DB|nr:histidine phosphatase family protein [Streptomonospora nanhaiensis]MBV2363320.1 histidine phosphatase family protein [Streptomonospora nanhaiensis]